MSGFLARELLGNSVLDWCLALAGAVAGTMVLCLAKRFAVAAADRAASKTDNLVDDAFVHTGRNTKKFTLFALSAWAASRFLELDPEVRSYLDTGFLTVLLIQVGLWGNAMVSFLTTEYLARRAEQHRSLATALGIGRLAGKAAVWGLVVLVILQNLGVEVTALVAGLGIGGIAVGLAMQNILSDLLSSLAILLDRPFEVGDFIVVDGYMGTVEKVGLKTTRIRALSGEQIIVPNGSLLASRIRNYKRMSERRASFTVGVTYDTPREKVEKVPGIIKEVVEGQPHTRFDRSHLSRFGDSALVFETVYFMTDPDYNLYMDTQQAINLALIDRFKQEGIEFAYPTQTVYVKGSGGGGTRTAR